MPKNIVVVNAGPRKGMEYGYSFDGGRKWS